MMELNPAHIVSTTDYSPQTVRSIIAHLEASTDLSIWFTARQNWMPSGRLRGSFCDTRRIQRSAATSAVTRIRA